MMARHAATVAVTFMLAETGDRHMDDHNRKALHVPRGVYSVRL